MNDRIDFFFYSDEFPSPLVGLNQGPGAAGNHLEHELCPEIYWVSGLDLNGLVLVVDSVDFSVHQNWSNPHCLDPCGWCRRLEHSWLCSNRPCCAKGSRMSPC